MLGCGRANLVEAVILACACLASACSSCNPIERQEVIARYRAARAHPMAFAEYKVALLGDEPTSGRREGRGMGQSANVLNYWPSPEWRDGWRREQARLAGSQRLWDSLETLVALSPESNTAEMILKNGTMRMTEGYAIFLLRRIRLAWPIRFVSCDAEWGVNRLSGKVTWQRYSLGSNMSVIYFHSFSEGKHEPRSPRNHGIREFGSQGELNAAIRQWIVTNPDLLVAVPELRHLVGASPLVQR